VIAASLVLNYLVNGLTIGSFLSLVALGYTMVYGIIRLINFAHGDLFMVGAFVGWSVLNSVVASLPVGLAILVAFLVSMAVTGVVGALIARAVYQPLMRAPRLSILIAALGVSLALENAVQRGYGEQFKTYPHVLPQQGFVLAGVSIGWAQLGMFVLSILLMLGLFAFVNGTTVGTAMRALAMDQDAARLMGIDVERIVILTFFLGAALAAAAGVMEGLYYTQINFFMGFAIGLRAFTAAVLGGIGNIPGAMVSGLLIGLLSSFSAGYLSSQWTDLIVFAVLILVLVVKPTGLFGERVVEKM
jgi:branched-chain amino acid transport system permease protein